MVFIVGSGFSGLVAAWSLSRDGFDVTVVDSSSRSGGLIESLEGRYGLVETAANGLLSSALVEELFRDCGLKIHGTKKSAHRRFLCVDSEVTRYPLSLIETLAVIPKFFRLKQLPPQPAETLDEWGLRALGPAMTEKVLSVVTLGVYGCDAKDLSANLLLGRFFDPNRLRNRRGRHQGTVSSKNGLEELLKSLRQRLEQRGVKFVFDSRAEDIVQKSRSAGPSTVILATPAWKAAQILKALSPDDPRIDALSRVQSIPLVSVTMFYKRAPSRRGFGTLFSQTTPKGEPDGLLGCLQNSEIFENRSIDGVHSETWILGGLKQGENILAQDDDGIIDLIFKKRDRWIDPESEKNLLEAVVTRWPQAIPHYSTELEQVMPVLKSDQNDILLFGNYLGDLGLASILESTRRLNSRIKK